MSSQEACSRAATAGRRRRFIAGLAAWAAAWLCAVPAHGQAAVKSATTLAGLPPGSETPSPSVSAPTRPDERAHSDAPAVHRQHRRLTGRWARATGRAKRTVATSGPPTDTRYRATDSYGKKIGGAWAIGLLGSIFLSVAVGSGEPMILMPLAPAVVHAAYGNWDAAAVELPGFHGAWFSGAVIFPCAGAFCIPGGLLGAAVGAITWVVFDAAYLARRPAADDRRRIGMTVRTGRGGGSLQLAGRF